MGQIIQIKNWDTYQHYHKNKSARNERFSMVWFKMYADSLQDSSFMELNSNLKWIFIGLMCLACKTNNNISSTLNKDEKLAKYPLKKVTTNTKSIPQKMAGTTFFK